MTKDALSRTDLLAQRALGLWDLPPGAEARRINVSENVTYRIEAPGCRAILRVHRPGYHTRAAIASELAWMTALGEDGVLSVPRAVAGRDGETIQHRDGRHFVLFDHLDGRHPDESGDLAPLFGRLGTLAARTHGHSAAWTPPPGFTRHAWDLEAVFGPRPVWGDWRDAPNVTPAVRGLLDRVETAVTARLTAFGRGPERYGLIHADMRLANLLIDGAHTHVIDFDDCGFGWFLYDFAAAVSFIEDDPRLPALRAAWVAGYRAERTLSDADEAEIDSFVMLRRMALLAWIGSHRESTEPQALAPHFAGGTAALGEAYLSRFG